MYSKYCGVVKEEIDVCPNVGWIADFADPQTVLNIPFNGKLIVTNGTNSNWGQVNHPQINKAMEAAKRRHRHHGARDSVGEDRQGTRRRSRGSPVRLGQAAAGRVRATWPASASSGTSARGTTAGPR